VLETIMLTISNNFSFIRVAAFAATHVILSKIIIDISNMMGYFGIIMIIFGNAIIICMEGLIVGIQTIRLEYYEFFSKFFIKKGRLFMPFKIERKKYI
jgi:V/A-type H+-transporting ATPase subunit I